MPLEGHIPEGHAGHENDRRDARRPEPRVCLFYTSHEEKATWVRGMANSRSAQGKLVVPIIALLSEKVSQYHPEIEDFLRQSHEMAEARADANSGALRLDPSRLLEFIEQIIEDSDRQDARPCCFIIDMTLAARSKHNRTKILAFEKSFHELITHNGAEAVCLYPADCATADALFDILEWHTVFSHRGRVWRLKSTCDNGIDLPTRTGLNPSAAPAVASAGAATDMPKGIEWQDLASGIVRDFNTIFMLAMNHAKNIEHALSDMPELSEDIQRIIGLAQSGKDLVDQISEFAGQSGISQAGADIRRVLTGLADITAPLLPAGIDLEVELGDALPSSQIDPMHLEQAIFNLIMNAREALDGRGTIRLIASAEKNGVPEQGSGGKTESSCAAPEYIRVQVEDNGCGMSPDVLERACEPLFTTKFNAESAGLGLAIVSRIIAANHGHIEIDSSPGKGTRFDLWLPAASADRD